MSAAVTTKHTGPSGEVLLGAMVAGVGALVALIALLSRVGEWWLLPPTFAVLLGLTAVVMFAVGRMLAQQGDEDLARAAVASRTRRERAVTPARSRGIVARPAAATAGGV
jgi:hypothetical protein